MSDKPLPIRGKIYDHPEHFRDRIAVYSSEERDIPEQLKDLLLEQCGHRCSVCREPNYEIHHIQPLEQGGRSEYENLIVLCPNCHTRVHREDIPSQKQLRHYKLKEEVAYGLPIINNLSSEEKDFIKALADEPEEEMVFFSKRYHDTVDTQHCEEARKILRRKVGLIYLESEGIIRTEYEDSIILGSNDEEGVFVALLLRITDKGIRWIKYLKTTDRLVLF